MLTRFKKRGKPSSWGENEGGKILNSLTDYKNKTTFKKKAFNIYELF